VVFGLGGVAFALGNLLLARALSPAQFGAFTLFVALVQIGASIGPLGLDGLVNRRPGGVLLPGRALLTSGVVAAATAILASTLYRMNTALVVALIVSITAGGASQMAAATFQSQRRFGLSLSLSQGHAVALLGVGALAVITRGSEPRFLAALVAASYAISASVGWGILARGRSQGSTEVPSFLEGLSLLGISVAALILMQLERVLAPRLLTLEDLATFAVVAALVGSPFRMLQMGAGYALLPRLSTASSPEERRQLVWREALAVMFMSGSAALLVWFAAPWIADWLLAGKYELGTSLMIATLVSGGVKVVDSFATTPVRALGTDRQLAMLNSVSWGCVGVGVMGGWIGARWGLVGLIYGVTLGWVVRTAIAGALSARLLPGVPVTGAQQPGSPGGIPW
jgi:O-antigen/teichoic acid export membrane protein